MYTDCNTIILSYKIHVLRILLLIRKISETYVLSIVCCVSLRQSESYFVIKKKKKERIIITLNYTKTIHLLILSTRYYLLVKNSYKINIK